MYCTSMLLCWCWVGIIGRQGFRWKPYRWIGSEARVPTAGATGVDQKATAAEETPLHYTDWRHRLHQTQTGEMDSSITRY
jgi:hypothetical protein